jgi:hypothetical protein
MLLADPPDAADPMSESRVRPAARVRDDTSTTLDRRTQFADFGGEAMRQLLRAAFLATVLFPWLGVVSPASAATFQTPAATQPSPMASTGLTLDQLRSAQYSLPLVGNQETTFRLVNGAVTLPNQLGTVQLLQDKVVFGDLNGDGIPDAAVILALNSVGSGTFFWAIALLDVNGVPVQAARQFLGDRVLVNNVTIANGQVTVNFLTHGPTAALALPPTQPAVVTLRVQTGATGLPITGGFPVPLWFIGLLGAASLSLGAALRGRRG